MTTKETNADLYIVNAMNELNTQAITLAQEAGGITSWEFRIYTERVRDSYQWCGQLEFEIGGPRVDLIIDSLLDGIYSLRPSSMTLRFIEEGRDLWTTVAKENARKIESLYAVRLRIVSYD